MNYYQFTGLVIAYTLAIVYFFGLFIWNEKRDLKKTRQRQYLDVTSELAHRPIQDEVSDIKISELL